MRRAREGLLDLLESRGVELIFGNPGSTEVPLLDSLVDRTGLRYVLVLHEGVAISMADGYAQLGDRPAVVSVHATPGVANIIGGLFLARSHRSPVVVIAGQQDSRLLARRPFLASDVAGLAAEHTKFSTQVQRAEDLLPTVERAFDIALTPPRGPVLVAIPRDLYDVRVSKPPPRGLVVTAPAPSADPSTVQAAAEAVVLAGHPVVLSGNGVGAQGERAISKVVRLAETIGARVYSEHNATNMHFPADHGLYLGGSAHGTALVANWLSAADLVVAVGCELFMEEHFDSRPIIPPTARVIQISEDRSEIGRATPVTFGFVGDLGGLVHQLTDEIVNSGGAGFRRRVASRTEEVHAERRHADERRHKRVRSTWDERPIRMPRVYAELRSAMPPDSVLVDEAVNMASYLHDHFPLTMPNTFLSSKQSWLGWGIGAALGAVLASSERRVVAVLGDGSAAYATQALWTAAQEGAPLMVVVLNNGGYMAVQNHLRDYGGAATRRRRYIGSQIHGIDFAALARGYGVNATTVDDPDSLRPAFEEALATNRPTLIEVMVDPDDAGLDREPIPRK